MTPRQLLALAASLALLASCQAQPPATAPTTATAAAPAPEAAAPPVVTLLSGRAMVGSMPLADAEVVVFDPIADALPAAPGAGDGVRLEQGATSVRTDADGRFTLPLALKVGQAAELYVSNGAQSVCGVIVGPAFAVRNAGKTPLDADPPLLLDTEATTTAGVMLGSLKALGKAAAKRRSQGPEAVLALQAKALDAMAEVVGATAADLVALAGTADVARKIAANMVQADPRLPAPAARRVLAAGSGAHPVLGAVIQALEASGVASRSIADTLAKGEKSLHQAEQAAFSDDAELVVDLAAEAPAAEPKSGGSGTSAQGITASLQVSITPGSVEDPADTDVQLASTLTRTGPFSLGDLRSLDWYDTGVVLSPGQQFAIQASASGNGNAYFDGSSSTFISADGNETVGIAACRVPHVGSLGFYGAVIGRIGTGPAFQVGSNRPLSPAEGAGHLFLTINNAVGGLQTEGAVNATVWTR